MRVVKHEHPVVFAFIAWMKHYRGASLSDIPTWAGAAAPGGWVADGDQGYTLGETRAFHPCKQGKGRSFHAGDVQHDFGTRALGGDDKAAKATVIWCAADPDDGERVKVVGLYRGATVHAVHQRRPRSWSSGRRSGSGEPHDYNVTCRADDAVLFPVGSRPAPPSVPGSSRDGRWQSNAKVWTGETKPLPEQKALREFVRKILAHGPGPQPPSQPERISFGETVAKYRRGQAAFRRQVVRSFGGTCAISGCVTGAALSACHVIPVGEPGSRHSPENAILLRLDLHLLFDRHLLSIDPGTRKVWVSPRVTDPMYAALKGRSLGPSCPESLPCRDALQWHWERRKQPSA